MSILPPSLWKVSLSFPSSSAQLCQSRVKDRKMYRWWIASRVLNNCCCNSNSEYWSDGSSRSVHLRTHEKKRRPSGCSFHCVMEPDSSKCKEWTRDMGWRATRKIFMRRIRGNIFTARIIKYWENKFLERLQKGCLPQETAQSPE